MFAFLRWLYSPKTTLSKSLQYRRRRRLVGQHTSTITALSFSSCGTYLASSGVDGKLVIWSVQTGNALHVVHGDAGILTIAWATDSPSQSLLCGVANGTVISVKFDSDLSATGHKAHRYPVECLVINHPRVATGAFHQVFLWDYDKWCREASYDAPLSDGANAQSETIVTALHWMRTKECSSTLVVSYLHHGIVFWNTLTHTRIRCLPLPSFVASTSISPDHRLLAVSNLTHGFDIYNLETYAIEGRMLNGVGIGRVVPVLFIHHGCAVIGGNTTGTVRMWDVDSAHFMHALEHGDQKKILSVDAYFHIDAIHDQDKFLIATGVEGDKSSYVQLWQAEDIYAKRNVFMHMSKETISTTNRTCFFIIFAMAFLCFVYIIEQRYGGPELWPDSPMSL